MSVEQTIVEKLQQAFSPELLDVENESHGHSVPANSETHFKVVMVSEAFVGARAVQRHQKVYGALADELQGGVHALALHLFAPAEWSPDLVPTSPKCMGGSKHG